MNGKARRGGVDGAIYRGDNAAWLTVEPTNPGAYTAHLWILGQGAEGPGVALPAAELRRLAASLIARADLIEKNGEPPHGDR